MSDEIIVLSEKDQARKRINVFHGSATNYINMIKELIGNSLDIFDNNKLNTIKIIIHNENKIEYIDSGNGIPVEGTANNGQPNYQAIFEKSFAGSKYSNSDATIGQNGIFLFTLSMTCENIEYFIARPNGNLYNISYHKGDRQSDLKVIGKEDTTYSRIIFELDKDVWINPKFTFENISQIAQAQASLGNVKIIIEDKINNKNVEYYYPNGIIDYFKEMTINKSFVSDNIRIQKIKTPLLKNINKNDTVDIDLLFSYANDSNEDIQKDFLNTADLILHGTIQDGIILGLKNSIHKWLKANNKYNKNEKQINNDDISTGLNYICNVKSLYVEYDNQTKQKTSALHYKPSMQETIEEFMEVFFIENPLETEKICNQILINKRSREKSDDMRLNLKKKLQNKSNGLSPKIAGLKNCDFRNSTMEEREFYITEGVSPSSTVIDARDPRIMGVYGLRGKFISSLKNSVKDVLNNEPAQGVINGLGCGISIPKSELKLYKNMKTFDINELQYGKIFIATDMDEWGYGIALSLITFFYKFMPVLLEQGRIYLCVSPRYEIETNKKDKDGNFITEFAYNELDKEKIIQRLNNEKIKYIINIVKGLGQLNKSTFWLYVLDKNNRRNKQIICKNINDEKLEILFNTLMGDDIIARKKYVKENITDLNINELD
jgi:DNA gyrase subunit B